MKTVLLLGASGLVGPHLVAGLEEHFHVRLGDIKPNPDGRPVQPVDVTQYQQVYEAARGVDAILNFTVNRYHPTLSFGVNVVGAYHVLRAAAELGIPKVIHTGPEFTSPEHRHEFDVDDVPLRSGTEWYWYTKLLSLELCQAYAREYPLQVICLLFSHLGPCPTGPLPRQDLPVFTVLWPDLVEALRLAVEVDRVPDNYQCFNLHSYLGHGKILLDKVARVLGYQPGTGAEALFRRPLRPDRGPAG